MTKGAAEAAEGGTRSAWLHQVMPVLRERARAALARERCGHTLQPTALMNEVFLRLDALGEDSWKSPTHFLAAATLTMRRVLVDYARARRAVKRGGGGPATWLDPSADRQREIDDLLDLDEVLRELARSDSRAAQVVELRWFEGLRDDEIAERLGMSERAVRYEWTYARAWLHRRLRTRNE